MKKYAILFLLILLFSTSGWAEMYTVLKVIGDVRVDGKPVEPWALLSTDTELTFGDASSALRVIQGKQTYTISGEKAAKKSGSGELAAILKSAFVPTSPVKRASSKGLITTKHDMRLFLTASKDPDKPNPFLVIDAGEYQVPADVYELKDEEKFFFLFYRWRGEDIYKLLPNTADQTFAISPDIYVLSKGEPNEAHADPAEIKGDIQFLYAVDADHDERICTFKPVFITTTALKTELTPMVESLRKEGLSDLEIKNFIGEYLVGNYGEPGEDVLAGWLRENFGLEF